MKMVEPTSEIEREVREVIYLLIIKGINFFDMFLDKAFLVSQVAICQVRAIECIEDMAVEACELMKRVL